MPVLKYVQVNNFQKDSFFIILSKKWTIFSKQQYCRVEYPFKLYTRQKGLSKNDKPVQSVQTFYFP